MTPEAAAKFKLFEVSWSVQASEPWAFPSKSEL